MPKIVCSTDDWIKLGYQLFALKGIEGLVVEQMANTLKCNKSSFYWHFKTKASFLDEIVNYWILKDTQGIINNVEKQVSPKEKWETFLQLCFQHDPHLEFIFYLKRYAKKHKKYQQIIEDIDNKRLEFTATLFMDLGHDKSASKIKASVFYKYLIGYHEMHRFQTSSSDNLKFIKKELSYLIKI